MTNIVTWEYYSSLYSGVTQEEFAEAEKKAEKAVELVIGPIRWAGITADTFGYGILKDCICRTMDQQASDALAGLGKGITSVSNDGYSENYANVTAADVENSLKSSIKYWLSGTGLVGAY